MLKTEQADIRGAAGQGRHFLGRLDDPWDNL
jgi:hypothetical protein